MSVADALADGIERYGVSVLGIVGRLTAFRSNVCGARSVSGSFQEMHMGKYSVAGSGADCKSVAFGFGWFDSIFPHFATIAQQVEQLPCKQDVPGSIPGGGLPRPWSIGLNPYR